MINLRVMSNCVYFVGRAISGEDSISSLTKRAEMYAQRMVWVRDNRDKIVSCIVSKMGLGDGTDVATQTGGATMLEAAAPAGFVWGGTF